MVRPEFLKEVQAAGWRIERVNPDDVVAGCPQPGCGLKVKLTPKSPIREACPAPTVAPEVVVRTFEDARKVLRPRRDALFLTIKEVEEVAGMAVDYLAKFEKDNPSKYPNVQTFIEWAQTLGYEVVLRPAELPPLALRVIADTRHLLKQRVRMQAHHQGRRASDGKQTPE